MHEGDIIFSANQGDSSMEDEDLQAKEIKEAYSEINYSEEVAGFQINEKCTKMISVHEKNLLLTLEICVMIVLI